MDHDDWVDHWNKLWVSIVVEGSKSQKRRSRPVDAHFDRLESELGLRLPLTYRTFEKVFGPGRLMAAFTIFSPGYRGYDVIDFLANNKWQKAERERRDDPDRIGRLVAFSEVGSEYFCWDPEITTSKDEVEYQIVKVPKDQGVGVLVVADSFRSFIEDICVGGQYWQMIGEENQPTWEDEDGETRNDPVFEIIGEAPTSSV